MCNLPPEIDASTMRPPFDSRITLQADRRDTTATHRIIFGGEGKWSIVGYEYGSPVVSSHDTIQDAREALKGLAVAQ